jgi:hypothetical protein
MKERPHLCIESLRKNAEESWRRFVSLATEERLVSSHKYDAQGDQRVGRWPVYLDATTAWLSEALNVSHTWHWWAQPNYWDQPTRWQLVHPTTAQGRTFAHERERLLNFTAKVVDYLQRHTEVPSHVEELFIQHATALAMQALPVAESFPADHVRWHNINERVKTRLASLWRNAAATHAAQAQQIKAITKRA